MAAEGGDRFHEVFLRLGGRFDHTALPLYVTLLSRAETWLTLVRDDPKSRPNFPKITIGYIDNPQVNACSCLQPDGAFIGICEGTVVVFFDIFNRMLSHREIFPHIGDPSHETSEETLQYLPQTAVELVNQLSERKPFTPHDEVRWNYAGLLMFTAFDFIVFHEIAHVLNGHICLIEERGYPAELEEVPTPDGGNSGPHFRQTLEMDADAFAVSKICALRLLSTNDDVPQDHPFHTVAQRAFMIQVALYSTLRLYGFGENTPFRLHPAPNSRRYMVLNTIQTWVEAKLGQEVGAGVLPELYRALKGCEDAFAIMTGLPIPTFNLEESLSHANLQWEIEVIEKWAEIFPDLWRLAFTDRMVLPL